MRRFEGAEPLECSLHGDGRGVVDTDEDTAPRAGINLELRERYSMRREIIYVVDEVMKRNDLTETTDSCNLRENLLSQCDRKINEDILN